MRKISAEELKIILGKHLKWLKNEDGWEKADLRYADLSNADLSNANLRYANLRYANLRYANLSNADLCYTNLSNADLFNADLRYTNLSNADLTNADLSNANLSNADLSNANLRYANLSNADLCYTNLSNADLFNADLRYTNLSNADLTNADLSYADLRNSKNIDKTIWNIYTIFYPLQCPERGAYTAYKKASNCIVELLIPADAKRSSATSRKCRASKSQVISITYMDGSEYDGDSVRSDHDYNFVYRIGETVEVPDFDENRWNECAPGIHHFITREEAVKYS